MQPIMHCIYHTTPSSTRKAPAVSFNWLTETIPFLCNNILAGAHTGGYVLGTPDVLDSAGNQLADLVADISFIDPVLYNYHLCRIGCPGSRCIAEQIVLGHSLGCDSRICRSMRSFGCHRRDSGCRTFEFGKSRKHRAISSTPSISLSQPLHRSIDPATGAFGRIRSAGRKRSLFTFRQRKRSTNQPA